MVTKVGRNRNPSKILAIVGGSDSNTWNVFKTKPSARAAVQNMNEEAHYGLPKNRRGLRNPCDKGIAGDLLQTVPQMSNDFRLSLRLCLHTSAVLLSL